MAFPPDLSELVTQRGTSFLNQVKETAFSKMSGAVHSIFPGALGDGGFDASGSERPEDVETNNPYASAEFQDNFVPHSHYIVSINSSADLEVAITGWMPDSIGLSVSNSYSTPYSGLISDLAAKNPFTSSLARSVPLYGGSLETKFMTTQAWGGTAHQDISFRLQLLAETDPFTEVVLPLARLLALFSPREAAFGFLVPPGSSFPVIGSAVAAASAAGAELLKIAGPKAAELVRGLGGSTQETKPQTDQAAGGSPLAKVRENKISLQIGQFLRFDDVLPVSARPDWDMTLDEKGNPIKAEVDLSFTLPTVLTRKDWAALFNLAGGVIPGVRDR